MQPTVWVKQDQALNTYQNWLKSLNDLMFDALQAIMSMDCILNQLQPIKSGRLRVMWFSLKPTATQYLEEKEPLIVQWQYHANCSEWRATRVPLKILLRRQMTRGAFAQHARLAKAALEELRILIGIYQRAKRILNSLGSWIKGGSLKTWIDIKHLMPFKDKLNHLTDSFQQRWLNKLKTIHD
jgi:hypothetical protein